MITIEDFNQCAYDDIIVSGNFYTKFSPHIPAYRFYAKRGHSDWAMYIHKIGTSQGEYDEKVTDEAAIRKECTDEVFSKYR